MDSGWLVGGQISCESHATLTRLPSINTSFWWRHTVPKHAESPPPRHFIQRQRQIMNCLQERLWVVGYCNACITSGHCWEVCWLARISVWAKSGGRSDPRGEWCSSGRISAALRWQMLGWGQWDNPDNKLGYMGRERGGENVFWVNCREGRCLRYLYLLVQ